LSFYLDLLRKSGTSYKIQTHTQNPDRHSLDWLLVCMSRSLAIFQDQFRW